MSILLGSVNVYPFSSTWSAFASQICGHSVGSPYSRPAIAHRLSPGSTVTSWSELMAGGPAADGSAAGGVAAGVGAGLGADAVGATGMSGTVSSQPMSISLGSVNVYPLSSFWPSLAPQMRGHCVGSPYSRAAIAHRLSPGLTVTSL